MKTLIVLLTALASTALAAPAKEDSLFEDKVRLQNKQYQLHSSILDQVNREKKSTPAPSFDVILHTPTAAPSTAEDELAGRTTWKKPMVYKKKLGYRLLRDSEDEKAVDDSLETCGRQVNVKVCDEDGKIREMLRNSQHEISNVHTEEDNIQNSIKMARQVVENLQRDLEQVQKDNAGVKETSDSDKKLRDDIEEARKMLENLQEKLGTVNVHNTAARDSKAIQTESEDMNMNMMSENEKMAQWKEAIDNLKQNVEIAKNIEDGFKAADQSENLVPIGQTSNWVIQTKTEQVAENKDKDLNKDVHDRKSTNSQVSLVHSNDGKKTLAVKEEQHIDDDMKPSASENIEMKSIDIENHHPLRSENQEQMEHKEKSLEQTSNLHNARSGEEHNMLPESSMTIPIMSDLNKNPSLKNAKDPQDNLQSNESEIKSEGVTETKEIQPKSADSNDMMENAIKLMKMYEDTLNAHKGKNAVELLETKESPEKSEDKHETMKSVEDINTPKMQNVIEQSTKFIKPTNRDHGDSKIDLEKSDKALSISLMDNINLKALPTDSQQHSMKAAHLAQNIDYNETEQKGSLTKMKSVEDDFHLTEFLNIDDQQDSLMKAAESTLKMDRNHNIDYNETEHGEKKGKAVEDLTLKIEDLNKFSENNEHNMKADNSVSTEQNKQHKLRLERKETMERIEDQLNKLRKNSESNELLMETADRHHQIINKQNSDHLKSIQKSSEEPLRHHLTSSKSPENHMQHHGHHHSHHHSHHSDAEHDSHWAHESKHFASVKAAGNLKKDFMAEEHNMPSKMGNSRDADVMEHNHSHGHVSARHHLNPSYPNRHDMNVMPGGAMRQNSRSIMREAREGLQSEHMFHWQPSHEAPRTAYGGSQPSPSSGGGAVGVFPNANTGGCGIPLLLSCSPSVVSGTLAKSHPVAPPSYSAPSYRTEEDFGYLSKRDLKKNSDGRNTNILRTNIPLVTKQKTTKMLDTKM